MCRTQSHSHVFILDTQFSGTSSEVDDNHFIHLQAGTRELCILHASAAESPHFMCLFISEQYDGRHTVYLSPLGRR